MDPLADFNLWSGRPWILSLCSDVFLQAPLTQTIVISDVEYRSAVLVLPDTYVSTLRYKTSEIVPTPKAHHGLGFKPII